MRDAVIEHVFHPDSRLTLKLTLSDFRNGLTYELAVFLAWHKHQNSRGSQRLTISRATHLCGCAQKYYPSVTLIFNLST